MTAWWFALLLALAFIYDFSPLADQPLRDRWRNALRRRHHDTEDGAK